MLHYHQLFYRRGEAAYITDSGSYYIGNGSSSIMNLFPFRTFPLLSYTGSFLGINKTLPTQALDIVGNIVLSGYIFNTNVGGTPSNSNMIGSFAGSASIAANNSNFLGQNAGRGATNANNSNFFGQSAGISAVNAINSNFLGQNAGNGSANASYSTFIGFAAGANATSASNSHFVGFAAGSSATNAGYSIFMGYSAGSNAANSNDSSFIGTRAGSGATNAKYSIFIGYNSGQNSTNANNSIFIGYQSGYSDTTNNSGSKSSILIGDYTSTGGNSDSIAIGKGTKNSYSGQLNIGNVIYASNIYSGSTSTSTPQTTGKVGIGINNPTNSLDVSGNISCSVITASLFGSASYSTVASYATNVISGIVASSSFGGTPMTCSISNLSFVDTNYSITICGIDSRAWTYSNKTTSSFIINTNSSIPLTGEVSYQLIKL